MEFYDEKEKSDIGKEKALKISFFVLHLRHGGVEKVVSQMANNFASNGYEVEILSTYNLGQPAYSLLPEIQISYLTNRRPNREQFKEVLRRKQVVKIFKEGIRAINTLILKAISLRKAIKNCKSDIIICSRLEQLGPLSRVKNNKVLKVAQIHHDIEPYSKARKKLINQAKHIDILTFLTDELTREIYHDFMKVHHNGYPQTRFIWMPNFVTNSFVLEAKAKLSEEVRREQIIVTVARLNHEKGVDRLIDVWGRIAHKYDGWKFVVIGDGDQRSELEDKVKSLGLAEKVIFTGMLDTVEIQEYLSLAQVFVLGSRTEGFGLVLIEAATYALPLIAFDVRSGPRNIINNKVNGFLIEDDNIVAFAESLEFLLNDSRSRFEMGQHAAKMATGFTESTVMSRWYNAFQNKEISNGFYIAKEKY